MLRRRGRAHEVSKAPYSCVSKPVDSLPGKRKRLVSYQRSYLHWSVDRTLHIVTINTTANNRSSPYQDAQAGLRSVLSKFGHEEASVSNLGRKQHCALL